MNKKTNIMIQHCIPALLFLGAFTASLANAQRSGAQSVSDIKAKAQAGDPDALAILSYLITNNEVPGNKEEALNFAKTSAERGSCLGQYWLGFFYDSGVGIAKDPAQATALFQKCLPELVKKADSGNSFAQFFLGMLYFQGKGVAKDPVEAIKWLRKSVDQGNADAKKALDNLAVVEKSNAKQLAFLTKIVSMAENKSDSEKYGGPSTEVVVTLTGNGVDFSSESDTIHPDVHLKILRGEVLTATGTAKIPGGTRLFPIRIKIWTDQNENFAMVSTFYFYKDSFGEWDAEKVAN